MTTPTKYEVDVILPPSGYPIHFQKEDTTSALKQVCGSASREFPKSLWIEPRNWKEAAADARRYRRFPRYYIPYYSNQDPTHECTCHALAYAFTARRNASIGVQYPDPVYNQAYPEAAMYGHVSVSPLSVYSEANPGQWGGAMIRDVLNIAIRRGFLPDKIQPRDYGFKHTLQGTAGQGNQFQSSGRFVRVEQFQDGWEDTAKWFRIDEVIFPDIWEQLICLLIHGYPIEVGRDGHAICYCDVDVEQEIVPYPDSYNVMRADSFARVKRAMDGAFAVASVTLPPENWLKPVG